MPNTVDQCRRGLAGADAGAAAGGGVMDAGVLAHSPSAPNAISGLASGSSAGAGAFAAAGAGLLKTRANQRFGQSFDFAEPPAGVSGSLSTVATDDAFVLILIVILSPGTPSCSPMSCHSRTWFPRKFAWKAALHRRAAARRSPHR